MKNSDLGGGDRV